MTPLSTDRARPVRPGEALDAAALEPYLRARLGGAAEAPMTIAQFPSGFSNLTYLIRFGAQEYVLRRPPFGAAVRSGHDMGREYRVLSHLYPIYPKVPRPVLLCEDAAVIGAPFFVMERVTGVILRGRMPADAVPPPKTMARIATAAVETLAELHAVDLDAAGLDGFGRPEGYIERQIQGWRRRYQQAQTDPLPAMEAVGAWLEAHRPPGGGVALIHNDFKYDNLVLAPDDGYAVRAVLDWEMATVGDPLMDLGTLLGYWVEADDAPVLRHLALSPTMHAGNPSRTDLVAQYAALTGRDVGDGVFYYTYGLFKIAVIIQQIYYRYRRGHTRDPRFAKLDQGVAACARTAHQAILKGRLDRLFT